MRQIPRFIPSLTVRELFSALKPKRKKVNGHSTLEEFAEQFAKYIGVSYAIPAPSGRAALAGLIQALKLPKGGEVILPSLTFHAIPLVLKEYGLKPRFIDINPDTYCIDTDCLERVINSSTVAIMPVHLYGRACEMSVIMQIAKQHDLVVIEDCAQACGGVHFKHRLGSFGQGAFFSFSPHKNFPVLESGMVVTNSKKVAAKVTSFMKQFPSTGRLSLLKTFLYIISMRLITRPLFWKFFVGPFLRVCFYLGFDPIGLLTDEKPKANSGISQGNSSMPGELHGRVGVNLLKKLDSLNKQRIDNGNELWRRLQHLSGIEIPKRAPDRENIYMSFVILVKDHKTFRRRMQHLGVDTHKGNMFVGPHLPGLKDTGECKIAIDAVNRMVHLPIYPEMRESDITQVVEAVTVAISGEKE